MITAQNALRMAEDMNLPMTAASAAAILLLAPPTMKPRTTSGQR
ncbi:hypothetical protein [Amycolatopsis thermophila]|uniref:Uncharacterized protein n=1 Tax=Amycolatopsis thermophila TaxID=206084 RepID=A0ABU0F4W2_9PSEU|nr:hypothetical protein [Amycolatopsis thermophila]MDQ0382625.1 hypothetical protein [Amycolatopsis thermophila]